MCPMSMCKLNQLQSMFEMVNGTMYRAAQRLSTINRKNRKTTTEIEPTVEPGQLASRGHISPNRMLLTIHLLSIECMSDIADIVCLICQSGVDRRTCSENTE